MPTLKRSLPNILTVSRMIAAGGLLFCRPLSGAFICIYLYAGVSDVLDGLLARRLHADGALGARMDSVADLLFTAAALLTLLPAAPWERWMLAWTAGIALLRLVTLCIGLRKYRALPFLHTWANKCTGVMLFLLPVLYALYYGLTATTWKLDVWTLGLWVLGVIASFASVEELIITVSRDTLNRDVRGLLFSAQTSH